MEVLSCVFTVSVWSRGLQSLMETRYQDDGDSNASQERERPWPQVGDPFLSPLSSHVIVTCWILQGAPLGLVSSSHLLLMAGAASRAACATAGYPSPLSLPGLAAVLDWDSAQASPLSLLTAMLSQSMSTPRPPRPCLAYFDPRRPWLHQSVSVSLSSLAPLILN